jgi:hypothetical protein
MNGLLRLRLSAVEVSLKTGLITWFSRALNPDELLAELGQVGMMPLRKQVKRLGSIIRSY